MSTNKTTNYALHAWEKDDKFLMDEMNENFAKLDQTLEQELQKRDVTLKKKGQLVTGTYTGDGEDSQTFDLGAPVLAVLIERHNGTRPSESSSLTQGGLLLRELPLRNGVAYIDGNTIVVCAGDSSGWWRMNRSGLIFYYVAWVEQ